MLLNTKWTSTGGADLVWANENIYIQAYDFKGHTLQVHAFNLWAPLSVVWVFLGPSQRQEQEKIEEDLYILVKAQNPKQKNQGP